MQVPAQSKKAKAVFLTPFISFFYLNSPDLEQNPLPIHTSNLLFLII